MSRKGQVWEEWEISILRKHWTANRTPRENAIEAARALNRTPEGVLTKARECGFPTAWLDARGHSGKPDGMINNGEIWRLKSAEDAWRKAWETAHGNRGYNGQRI